jgi:chromosome segregation ATPase
MTEEEPASIHIGHLEQKLERIEQQIDQLRIEVESIATSPMASQLSGQEAAKELGFSLHAELMRLQQELNRCESELLRCRAQAASAEPH